MNKELFEQMSVAVEEYSKSKTKFKETSEKAAAIAQKVKEEGSANVWKRVFSEIYNAHTTLKKANVLWDLPFSHKEHPHVSFEYEEASAVVRVFYDNQKTGYCIVPNRPFLLVFDAELRHPQDMHTLEMTAAIQAIVLEWDDIFAETIKKAITQLQEKTAENNAQTEKTNILIRTWENAFSVNEKEDVDREDR